MKLARRDVIGLGAGALGASALSGCSKLEHRVAPYTVADNPLPPESARIASPAVRVLSRMAYGPMPGEVTRVTAMGITAYVEEQLHPDTIEEPKRLSWDIRKMGDSLDADPGLLFDQDDKRVVQALRTATLLRAVYSNRQLYERMVGFWSDHFNIYAFKGQGPQYKVLDDKKTIRPHALGKFRDLLHASARSAAMLGYLDNTLNERGHPNENYAREVMELHTLGVHGGYTQMDVQELARCLTGWTVQQHWHRGQFTFDSARHDNGVKRVLGMVIPAGGGVADAERVLNHLAVHPATAQHLATKLCTYFIGTAPDSLVKQVAAVYTKTGGDIAAMVRPILLSPDMLTAPPILKRPFDYLVSGLRALSADTDGGQPIQQHLEDMGQSLFSWPRPDGYPTGTHAWTGALLPRWNVALALSGDEIAGTTVDWDKLGTVGAKRGLTAPDALLEVVFGCGTDDPALAKLRGHAAAGAELKSYAALLLMSPQFQWR